jgi:hypothetical protein
MRCLLGLLAGCGIVMLAACSETEPPGPAGPTEPVAPITSADEMDTEAPAEEASDEAAQTEPVMEGNTGVATGQKAPSFRLKDQTGTERSLDEFLEQGKVALVFYRSADW